MDVLSAETSLNNLLAGCLPAALLHNLRGALSNVHGFSE